MERSDLDDEVRIFEADLSPPFKAMDILVFSQRNELNGWCFYKSLASSNSTNALKHVEITRVSVSMGWAWNSSNQPNFIVFLFLAQLLIILNHYLYILFVCGCLKIDSWIYYIHGGCFFTFLSALVNENFEKKKKKKY